MRFLITFNGERLPGPWVVTEQESGKRFGFDAVCIDVPAVTFTMGERKGAIAAAGRLVITGTTARIVDD